MKLESAKILDGDLIQQVVSQVAFTGGACGDSYGVCGFFHNLECGDCSKETDFYCFLFDERVDGLRCSECKKIIREE